MFSRLFCRTASPKKTQRLNLESLESRTNPAITATLNAGLLQITGSEQRDVVQIRLDGLGDQILVQDAAKVVATFPTTLVTELLVQTLGGNDSIQIDPRMIQPATLDGGSGNNVLRGGGGLTTLIGGSGIDKLFAGTGPTTFDQGPSKNHLFNVKPTDTALPSVNDSVVRALPVVTVPVAIQEVLTQAEVANIRQRAAAATASDDGIIVITDHNGSLLGLRIEGGVSPLITGNTANLVFAVDGALAKARTGAFFGNNQSPLTSRLVQFISQTTMPERVVASYPNALNPTLQGPGFVAPVGIAGHFPPKIKFTPQVDLFAIEYTNRDSILHPGPDGNKGTGDDILLPMRFNINPAFVPTGKALVSPESYGYISGLEPNAQARGLATLPGGIPIYKNGQMVGGIGVFYPGKTGLATEENSVLSNIYNPALPDRSYESEYVGFAALGGAGGFEIGDLAGIAPTPNIQASPIPLALARIDLVGITLDLFGPGGTQGPTNLVNFGKTLGVGNPNSGTNYPVTPNPAITLLNGTTVPEGWLVIPHDGVGISGDQVNQIIQNGIAQEARTRSALRVGANPTGRAPSSTPEKMVFAVCDLEGNVVGLYRTPDSTVFSLDVAVAKARNLAYYNNPAELQPIDQAPGVPAGVAFTSRTFRYLSLPRFPEGIDGAPAGPFSILNDGGTSAITGGQVGPRLANTDFVSVQGYSAFHPAANFRDPSNIANQNGVVFFPGASAVYAGQTLLGGLGVSGDGVDQDDVTTSQAILGYDPLESIRADNFRVFGIRIPYRKFNRNPEGGILG